MAITRDVESGWSDANLTLGCFIEPANFGIVKLKNLPYNDNTKPFGEIDLTHLPADYGDVYVNIKFYAYRATGTNIYVGIRILDSAGNTVKECKRTVAGGGEQWCSFKAESGNVYYLVAIRNNSDSYLYDIRGLGYSAKTKYGRRDYLGVRLLIYEDYYDAENSTADRDTTVNFYGQGIPSAVQALSEIMQITRSDVGNDKVLEIPFPTNAETGYNFETEQDLTGVMVLATNEFYGKTDLFNKAIVKFHILGVDVATIDLLTNDAGAESSEFVISSGNYDDAKVIYVINAKDVTTFESKKAKVGFRWKFDSSYEGVCT